LFRGVTVQKGATVENCILMHGTTVGSDADISYVIADKNVTVGEKTVLKGVKDKALILEKGKSF
ncbi:MAG: glucose-1-phosphate adenylyltransferase, partial [Clostridia bacterium]|nr:glucose-1-phosphate adenylyltransferase [Clostridia bacterium]